MQMLRASLILLHFCFLHYGIVNAQDKKMVHWESPTQLNRDHFRMKAPEKEARTYRKGRYLISTEGFIYCGISFSFSRSYNRVEYVIDAIMDPTRSWLAAPDDLKTLAHEQAHFNITEVYARRLRRMLISTRSVDKAKRLYDSHLDALERRQKEFDEAHKGESGVEEEWQNRIESELNRLSENADQRVVIFR